MYSKRVTYELSDGSEGWVVVFTRSQWDGRWASCCVSSETTGSSKEYWDCGTPSEDEAERYVRRFRREKSAVSDR